MLRMKMRKTDDYEKLVKFFVENRLEFDGDEEVEYLVAGAVIARREEKYIIDGIAVDEPYRRLKVGKIILDKVVERVKEMGGDSIYLVARAPEFFRKNGFQTIDPDDAPNFFECKQCPQYQVDCHPEVMKLEIV